MNEIIKKQLQNVKWAKLPPIDDTTTEFVIYRHRKPKLEQDKFYIIKIAEWIRHPSDNLSLAKNWNRGIVPVAQYMRCQVQQIMGNMVKIGCVAYDITTQQDDYTEMYDGLWLPTNGMELLEQLN